MGTLLRSRRSRPGLLPSAGVGFAATALALAAGGCAASGHRQPIAAVGAPPAVAAQRPPQLRLALISPRRGQRVRADVAVLVHISGGLRCDSPALRFVLDGRALRPTSLRFTIRGLRPGRHRLVVTLARDRAVHASSGFVVRAPARAPTPARGRRSCCTTTTAAPPPPATTTTVAPPPPQTATIPAPPPATTTTAPPPTGIPQGNGGDMDSDNNGGPSDGDGNV